MLSTCTFIQTMLKWTPVQREREGKRERWVRGERQTERKRDRQTDRERHRDNERRSDRLEMKHRDSNVRHRGKADNRCVETLLCPCTVISLFAVDGVALSRSSVQYQSGIAEHSQPARTQNMI